MANLATAKKKAAEADAMQGTGGLMTSKVDAAARGLLTAKVNPNQAWDVYCVVDRSGSMGNEFRSGAVQNAIDAALGFATLVDDDGQVPTIFFDSGIETHDISLTNFHGYLSTNRIDAGGSTNLTGALHELAKQTGNGDLFQGGGRGLFRRGHGAPAPTVKTMAKPVFCVIITDGMPDDPGSATDAIRALSYRGIWIKFIFVGSDPRGQQYLESLDDDLPVGVAYDRGGRFIDNVDMKKLQTLNGVPDAQLYASMFDEVSRWLTEARNAQLIS